MFQVIIIPDFGMTTGFQHIYEVKISLLLCMCACACAVVENYLYFHQQIINGLNYLMAISYKYIGIRNYTA